MATQDGMVRPRGGTTGRGSPSPVGWLAWVAAALVACSSGAASPGPGAAPPSGPDPVVPAGPEPASGADPQEPRLAGEYGLWVSDLGGELRVAWLTDTPARGLLEVVRDGERIHRVETSTSQGHSATFPRPGDGPLQLHYGELGAEAEDAPGPGGLHATTVHLAAEPARPPSVLTGVDSLFAVGDVHGEYDTLVRLLRNAGLVDAEGHWSGGTRHVAFLGDLLDRGDDVLRTLWFLYRLEREAARAGGGAHVVLGNHETMVFTDDLRYVSPKERLLATLHGTAYPRLLDLRESVLGRWLASRPGVMKVDGALLAHGGVLPAYAEEGVEAFNDSLQAYLREDLVYYLGPIFDASDTTVALVQDSSFVDAVRAERVVVMDSLVAQRRLDFLFADTSVFWFRGYVATDTLDSALDEVLERTGTRVHVVGHTPVRTILPGYGGRLWAVDLARPATEMLLLVPRGQGFEAWRYGLEGPPQQLAGGRPGDVDGAGRVIRRSPS